MYVYRRKESCLAGSDLMFHVKDVQTRCYIAVCMSNLISGAACVWHSKMQFIILVPRAGITGKHHKFCFQLL